mgnify:CR=1 FL=1
MTPTHLMALLEGLDVPNPQWWAMQPPDALRALGKAISDQAKQAVPDDRIERLGAAIGMAARHAG